MRISARSQMCIIIGDPVEHSLSPVMHNAAYEAIGVDDRFVFTAAQVKVEHIKTVIDAVRAMGIRGLTCTIPHKMEVVKFLDEVDPVAQKIGAVNTVVNDNGILKGYNTDWIGTVTPLEKKTQLAGKRVALIGAGGAARAMAYGVTQRGASLTVFNRTTENAQDLQNDFSAEIRELDSIALVYDHEIIINATPLGMGEHQEETPVPADYLKADHIVFDAVYSPKQTRLLREAAAKGAQVIHGLEMLLYQGIAQFELYTGFKAPEDVMRFVLEKNAQ